MHTEECLGAYVGDQIVDLNSAYALYLKEVEGRKTARRRASAMIPPCMEEFLEGEDESLKAAEKTLGFISGKKKTVVGLDGEKIFLSEEHIWLCAPIPRSDKVYCLAVNFYDHTTERIKDADERRVEIQRLKSLNLDIPFVFK